MCSSIDVVIVSEETAFFIFRVVDCVWNVMAHAQKPDFAFLRNGRVHLNRRGHQSSRLLAAEVCASAVVMLDTPCFEVVWMVLATHSIRQFPLHFPSRASPCAITFQMDWGSRFAWNIGSRIPKCTISHPRDSAFNIHSRWILVSRMWDLLPLLSWLLLDGVNAGTWKLLVVLC